MGVITAKGQQAVESASKQSVDLSKVMIRLKDGESVKVRLLGVEDYVEYTAVTDFNLGVYTQPIREPLGEKDYFIEAGKLAAAGKVDEKFKTLTPRKRYVVAMADVKSGELHAWDCSKSQFNTFVANLEAYKEPVADGDEIIFNFIRTGSKTDTTYSLMPVFKPTEDDLKGFHKFDGQEVPLEFFESVLRPRSAELQVGVLKEKGFPVEEFFPEVTLESKESDATEASPLDSI